MSISKHKHSYKMLHWERISLLLGIYDVVTVNLAYALALWLRFDGEYSRIPGHYIDDFVGYMLINTVCTIVIYYVFRLYNSIWRFASYVELERTIVATGISVALHVIGVTTLYERMPISYFLVGAMLQFTFAAASRFSYRWVNFVKRNFESKKEPKKVINVMVIGAGEAGRSIVRELLNSEKLVNNVCCIIDDNLNKKGRYIDNVPVVGTRDDIFENVKKYKINQIIIALPSAKAEDRRNIVNICKETGCELKIVPGIYQFIKDEVTVSSLKSVSLEDLLGRDPIKVNLGEIMSYVSNKVVLVTGGGGSIGSELCRQIAKNKPKLLIILDIYENNAYDIQQELLMNHPDLNLLVLIASVRDSKRMNSIFEQYHPDIVYHAAAHKHVPLMEVSPNEAIKNNVIGTYKTAKAAAVNGCQRFVLISTDKAVNPTNIMGASKRLCEMIVQTMNKHTDTEFVAVRFGNVLGSNGSVIPLFEKQIKNGGPVTVTHPDIVRYFMTIPEAVSLVLQAGAYAKGGEIFVLDMGEPVKIDDLARNLIKLSGFTPDVDIMVEYTGLRPGEKLYEEKLMSEEGMQKTANQLIYIGQPIPFDERLFYKQLEALKEACYNNSPNIEELVAEVVTTYQPDRDRKKLQ